MIPEERPDRPKQVDRKDGARSGKCLAGSRAGRPWRPHSGRPTGPVAVGGALGCGIHFVPGVTAGDPTSGGAMSGGLISGGVTSGGLMLGRVASGGPMSGGTAAGGLISGGLTSGGLTSGGAMSGGLTAHGSPSGSAGEGVRKTIVSPLVPASTGDRGTTKGR